MVQENHLPVYLFLFIKVISGLVIFPLLIVTFSTELLHPHIISTELEDFFGSFLGKHQGQARKSENVFGEFLPQLSLP